MFLNFEKYHGLSQNQVIAKQKKTGSNILFKKTRKSSLDYAMKIFNEPMLMLLLITALIYFFIDQAGDGILMLIGVLFIIGIDLYQEAKTDKALEALKELSTPKIKVIRNGQIQTINNQDLVTGDLLLAREGDRVAGDGLILESSNFSVDESILTGESGAVFKHKITQNGDFKLTQIEKIKKVPENNRTLAGTLVLSGQALILISSIGTQTQYGKIGTLLAEITEDRTPLQKSTGSIVKIFGWVGLSACLGLFIISLARTGALADSLIKGLTLAISVIPEEIPVVLTVFATLGAYRLTKKNALIKKINAIETLGHITTLCLDKTGTLTLNRMRLKNFFDLRILKICDRFKQNNPDHINILTKAVLTCQPEPFDPADISIFEQAKALKINIDSLHDKYQIIKEYAFDQNLKCMGYAWRSTRQAELVIKGSPEKIIELCSLNPKARAELLEQIEQLAARGLRVLGVAYKTLATNKIPANLKKIQQLEFVTLLGFEDPVKPQARQAVVSCQKAGIAIRMITGDHPRTASHIALTLGIKNPDKYLIGVQIDAMNVAELTEKVKNYFVFARISPEQKLRLVSALKKSGEVVAMIGDGVNDGPSLKEADVGVAMGQGGTNVAREAADLILMDDDLLTVTTAIRHGRRIYDNIVKSIYFIFTVHVYIILLALIIPLIGLTPFLLPVHIVLIELIIDPICALVFEKIPAEPDIMRRKPRDPNKHLINSNKFMRTLAKGIFIFLLAGGIYYWALLVNLPVEAARALGLSVVAFSNLFLALSAVSRHQSLLKSFTFIFNKTFIYVYATVIIGLLILIYLPGANTRFGLAPVSPTLIIMTAFLGFLPAVATEVYKKIKAVQPCP